MRVHIVIIGFQHPYLGKPEFKTASPVMALRSRHIFYMFVLFYDWDIECLDMTTNFLQIDSGEEAKDLWTTGVNERKDARGAGF